MSRPEVLGRESYPIWAAITVHWSDVDRYGHVNNAVHYRWFDDAVNGWLVANGLLQLGGDGPINLVAETACAYVAPLHFPGSVDVGLFAERVGTSSVRYRLGIFAAGWKEAAAEGTFVHVQVDRPTRRPQPLSPRTRSALARIARVNPCDI